MHMRRLFAVLLASAVLALQAGALAQEGTGEAAITAVTEQNAYGSVEYPQLAGLAQTALQDDINKAIVEKGQIAEHLQTLSGLKEGGWGLTVNYKSTLQNGILSVLMGAYGEMPNGRMGQTYAVVNEDLKTGKPIAAADLFTDAEGAFAFMEQKLMDEVQPELSGYMENDALTPIPRETFFLTPEYITFYYPQDQFSMLSGYSGGCSFFYYELADYLNLSPGSVLDSLKAGSYLKIEEDTARRVSETAAEGTLPGVDVHLGDSLIDRLNELRLLVDPDFYPGGRFFEVEAPQMRGIWLLTDALTESYEHSQVLGIRAGRINLYGIRPGVTTMAEWRAALGEPESSATLDDYTAEDFRLPAGTSDYYTYGENKLRLHADEGGILSSVQLIR